MRIRIIIRIIIKTIRIISRKSKIKRRIKEIKISWINLSYINKKGKIILTKLLRKLRLKLLIRKTLKILVVVVVVIVVVTFTIIAKINRKKIKSNWKK